MSMRQDARDGADVACAMLQCACVAVRLATARQQVLVAKDHGLRHAQAAQHTGHGL
jgi:hypothetical protein